MAEAAQPQGHGSPYHRYMVGGRPGSVPGPPGAQLRLPNPTHIPMPDGILPHPTDSPPSLMVDAAVALALHHLLKWRPWWLYSGGGQGQHQRHPLAVCKGREAGTAPRLHPVQHGHGLGVRARPLKHQLRPRLCVGCFMPRCSKHIQAPRGHKDFVATFVVSSPPWRKLLTGPGGHRPRSYMTPPSPCCVG
jgi:hypothetical protein